MTAFAAFRTASSVVRVVLTHPANEGARVQAVFRAVRFQFRGRILRRPTLARLGDQSNIYAYLHRLGSSKVVYGNPPDYREMLVWRQFLKPGDVFIDVGANVGSYSIWAAEQGAEVVALEPAEDTFALLSENIALNKYPIRAIQAAVGASCGTARFTKGLDAVNRLHPEGAVETAVVTIDSVAGNNVVAGMKIDVEGLEIDVLRGCGRALSEHRIKLIQLEWNVTSRDYGGADRQPVADLLAKHGYSLYRPDSSGKLQPLSGLEFGPDVFARPPEELGRRLATGCASAHGPRCRTGRPGRSAPGCSDSVEFQPSSISRNGGQTGFKEVPDVSQRFLCIP